MSNFMARLVTRSVGESPAVRPRIAPAFAQRIKGAAQAAAGEILRSAPEAGLAIAALPTGKPRVKTERATHPNASAESRVDLPRPATVPRPNPEAGSFRESHEEKTAGSRITRVVSAQAKETLPPSANPQPRTGTMYPRIEEKTGEHSQTEAAPGSVFQAVVVRQETKETLRVVDSVEQHVLAPSATPELRPAIRKTEQPFLAPRKTPATEPAIQVTIGKIEVRASIAAPKSTEKKTPAGAMSLEEYQRLRSRRCTG